jgi:hypothetical protein
LSSRIFCTKITNSSVHAPCTDGHFVLVAFDMTHRRMSGNRSESWDENHLPWLITRFISIVKWDRPWAVFGDQIRVNCRLRDEH